MLKKLPWRDAMIVFNADTGGSDGGQDDTEPDNGTGGGQTLEDALAELERTRAALKTANREAAERRKKLDDLAAAEQARAEKELTETQRAQARAEKAEADLKVAQDQARNDKIEAALFQAATKAGFADPSDAVALANRSGVTLEDGSVNGAVEAVTALVESKPHLVAQRQAPNINSNSGGKVPAVSTESIVERKRASGQYIPM